MTNHEKLMLAFKLVEEVHNTMDRNPCQTKGKGSDHLWIRRLVIRLRAAARRIKSSADEIERKDLPRHTKEVMA